MGRSEQSSRALELFDLLVELGDAERTSKLESIRAEDPTLAAELQRLLLADARTHLALDRGISARLGLKLLAEEGGDDADPAASGQRYGDFVLRALLGRGGMGEVWLAEREQEGFVQRAALKLLRSGLDSADLHRRFLQERRILADLSHPHIARFIDGGVRPDRQPWYAMDYVEGQPITQYAATHGLSVRRRVALLLDVCEAVAYAQSRLVVHRDLKPSNILVDGEGRVHLLDFGIAKLLETGRDNRITETGVTAMSPAYAAPEQILDGPISTATDVYALGLLLYELLSGRLPHERGNRPLALLAAAVTSEEFQRPSQWLQDGATCFVGIDREHFRRDLTRDLEAIVMMALRPEPERRYPSAVALASDLRRWLDGQAVLAAGDSLRYRVGKLLRRHQVGVSAAALVLVALCSGLGLALWQANLARAQAQRALLVKDFMLALFEESDPVARAQVQARTPRELVTAGLERAKADLGRDPLLKWELLADLGRLAGALGDPKLADEVLAGVLEQRSARETRMSPESAELAAELAAVRLQLGDSASARSLATQAVEVLREQRGGDPLVIARAEGHLARALNFQGELDAALLLSQRVHDSHHALLGAEHPETLARRYAVAVVLDQLDRLGEADDLLREVVEGLERALGENHARLVRPLAMRADLARREQRLADARPLFERAIALARRHLPAQHPTLGAQLVRYGDFLRRLGDHEAAMNTLEEAAACFPEGSTELAQVAMFRGQLLRSQGRQEPALAALRQAQSGYLQALGSNSVFPWAAAMLAADTLVDLGRLEEAEPTLLEVVEQQHRIAGPDSYDLALGSMSLGRLRRAQGRHDEAIELQERSLQILGQLYGEDNANAAQARLELAQSLRRGLRLVDAQAQIDRMLAYAQAHDGGGQDLVRLHLEAARLAQARNQGDAQRQQAERALGLLRAEHEALREELMQLLTSH